MWARFSWMNLSYLNSTIFGDTLVGNVIQGGNPGTGGSDIYNISAGVVHAFTPRLTLDANMGYVKHNTGVEQPGIEKNTGLDFLGIPGTNGPGRYQGGWPRFTSIGYDDYGTYDGYMPYWRWDTQQQMVSTLPRLSTGSTQPGSTWSATGSAPKSDCWRRRWTSA